MQKALLLSASFHPFFALVTSRLDCSPIGEQMAMCFSREDLMALMSPEEMAKAQRCARPVRMRDVFPMLPPEYHALRRRVQVGESLASVALAAVGDALDITGLLWPFLVLYLPFKVKLLVLLRTVLTNVGADVVAVEAAAEYLFSPRGDPP